MVIKLIKRFKKGVSWLLLAAMFIFNLGSAPLALANGGPTLTIGSQTASNGDAINVPIDASNFTDVKGLTFNVQYDTALLTYTGNTQVAISGNGTLNINNVGNEVLINWLGTTPLNLESGTLLTLQFTVTSANSVSANLTFTGDKEVNNSEGTHIVTNFVDGVLTLNPDIAGPTVASAAASPDPAKDGQVAITVNFADATGMNTSISPTVTVVGLTTTPYNVTQTSFAGNTWQGSFTLLDQNEEKQATITVAGAKDTPGNEMTANANAGAFMVDTIAPTAIFTATPAATTPETNATFTVAGAGVTHYKYKLDAGSYGIETPISQNINLTSLSRGSHTVSVIGRDAAGNWQEQGSATTYTWLISNYQTGDVVINEFFSDTSGNEWVELLNTTSADINLTGWELKDLAGNKKRLTNLDTIPANGLVVQESSGAWLNNGGDAIYLLDDTSQTINTVVYGSGEGAQVGAPDADKSASLRAGVWTNNTAPDKGWFNGDTTLTNIAATLTTMGIGSNLASLGNPATTTGLYFSKEGLGKIEFSGALNLTNGGTRATLSGLGTSIGFDASKIRLDPHLLDPIKALGANLTMYNVNLVNSPQILVDGVLAGANDATGVNYNADTDTLTFQAKHFSTYEVYYPVTNLTTGAKFDSIQAAVAAASSGDSIKVGPGAFTVADINQRLIIPEGKALTLAGTRGANNDSADSSVVTFSFAPQAGFYDVEIYASSTVVKDFVFDFGDRASQFTGILIAEAGEGPQAVHDVQIKNNRIYADGVAMQSGLNRAVGGLLIDGNEIRLDMNNNSSDGGAGIYINPYEYDANFGLARVSNNIVTGHLDFGIAAESGNVKVSGNTVQNTVGTANRHGIRYTDWYGYDHVNTEISGNTVKNMKDGIQVQSYQYGSLSGLIAMNNLVNNNAGIHLYPVSLATSTPLLLTTNFISGNSGLGVNNESGRTVDATKNWWGDGSGPRHASNSAGRGDAVSDNVGFTPWYINPNRTILSDKIADGRLDAGAGNLDFDTDTQGQASLPSGVNKISFTNNTAMDFSDNATNTSDILVSGGSRGLQHTIGGQSVTIGKSVKLNSGAAGQAVVVSNNDFDRASVSFPDGTTIYAPTDWDGALQPPRTGSSSGNAPAGFTVGDTVVEVGAPGKVLIFDKPVILTLRNVTGVVAYKAPGSDNWTQISNVCRGTYETPLEPDFPGECYISDGANTKIATYHFTSFAGLTTPTSGGSGQTGGGGGGYIPLWALGQTNQTPTPPTGPGGQTPTLPGPSTPPPAILPGPEGQVLGVKTYADGVLLRGRDKKVYIIENQRKRHIKTLVELRKYASQRIFDVPNQDLIQFPEVLGTRVFVNGSLIRGRDARIYEVRNETKLHIKTLNELRQNHLGKRIYDVDDKVISQYHGA